MRRLQAACVACYHGATRELAAAKAQVELEFGKALGQYRQMLKSVINEAEALAWQTPYPHLFFPVLAEEKAAEAIQWVARQEAIRDRGHSFNLAQPGLAAA
jgi:hypothetical protein